MRIDKRSYKKIDVEKAISLDTCRNGLLTLAVDSDSKKRYIHSKYDPVKEAQRQTSEFISAMQDKFIILIFGLGLGYHVQEIMNNLPETGKVYVFEPYPYVCRLFTENGGESLLNDERFNLFAYTDRSELRKDLSAILSLENCDAFSFFANPVYSSIFPNEYDMLAKEISSFSSELFSQKSAICRYGIDWSRNALINYKCLSKSASVTGLYGLFKGKTVIIVSAGPSLSKNIALLSEVEDRAVILSTDTAFKALEANDITPHLVVSISGSIKASQKILGSSYRNVPLVYKWQTAYGILEGHSGLKFYAGSSGGFMDETLRDADADLGILEAGGSVACTCLDLAVKSGAKNVIFLGQDLALQEKQTHAKDTVGLVSTINMERYSTAEGIDGKPVATLKVFDAYRFWFEKYIAERTNIRFIDATEGGALIRGTEIMTLSQAFDLFSKEKADLHKDIKGAFIKNQLLNDKKGQIVSKKYKQAYQDFIKAKALLEEMIAMYDQASPTQKQVLDYLDKLCAYTDSIRHSILRRVYELKNMPIGKYPLKELRRFHIMAETLEYLTPLFEDVNTTKLTGR